MPIPIEMPKLSDTMIEGTLLRWLKKEGDKIKIGDILAEVETDKATMEMEAFDDGVLEKIFVPDGSKVPVGSRIAQLSGESPSTPSPAAASTPPAPTPAAASTPPATEPATRVKASPLAKKIAASQKVDLSRLRGTGPGGRVIARDVQAAPPAGSSSAATSTPTVTAGTSSTPPPTHIPHTRIELSGMRRLIASRLLESKTQIPHFYLQLEADAAPLIRLRKQLNEAAEASDAPKITINDFVLFATARAATLNPKVNSAFAGDAVLQYETVHLAVAVAVEDGLVTPVIRDAQKLSLRQISLAVKDLATRARNKKLKPDEYQGGTLTVSNLGAYGVEAFSAIINPPQAAILAVGAIVKKPVVAAGNQIVVGERFSLALSCDHRVVDGAIGAEFLTTIRKFLEAPESLLF